MKNYIIAIDGPSGAGKSTLSKMIAKKLGIAYIDTGAMYRACALYAIELGVNPKVDSEKLRKILSDIKIDFSYENDEQKVYLNDIDVTREIREPHISTGASDISAIPFVRDKLVLMQREMAQNKSVLMDGRDIGTNVFPNADIKIYLTADIKDRAKRRYEELLKVNNTDYQTVLDDMIKRDENDKNREYAPLKQDENAKLLDTTGNSIDKSLNLLYNYIVEKLESKYL
jgi:cytidylate kinase